MSLSLVKKGLKSLDQKYSLLNANKPEKELASRNKNGIGLKRKLSLDADNIPAKFGLKKASDYERYRHSKTYIDNVKRLNRKEKELLPKPIDLARKEFEHKKQLLDENLSKIKESFISPTDKIKGLQSEVLNYDKLYGPKPIRRLKKRVRQLSKARPIN
ncbi:hypothetical protein DSO57_1021478 [Entomophthora muscae]|uniref:Uncharacterized protein n=1 Tax=Entomophthora muscae TaxID=34485 RepID=A0ACC2UCF8_9FUNG|nr:hypothetical protein DSO57_1021478 [Entomophthora muscae]